MFIQVLFVSFSQWWLIKSWVRHRTNLRSWLEYIKRLPSILQLHWRTWSYSSVYAYRDSSWVSSDFIEPGFFMIPLLRLMLSRVIRVATLDDSEIIVYAHLQYSSPTIMRTIFDHPKYRSSRIYLRFCKEQSRPRKRLHRLKSPPHGC